MSGTSKEGSMLRNLLKQLLNRDDTIFKAYAALIEKCNSPIAASVALQVIEADKNNRLLTRGPTDKDREEG